MSMQLYLKYGSIQLNFQSDGYILLDGFYPETPSDMKANLTERFNILVKGSSIADLETKVRAINLAFEHARANKKGPAGVYLHFSTSTEINTWRARVYDGLVMLDARLDKNLRSNKVIIGVVVERAPFWEGPEAQIALTNPNGTNNLTGLRIYNCNDGATIDTSYKRHNYVAIDGSDLIGDLPGATRLELVNLYAGTSEPKLFLIGHNYTNPDSFGWNFEGENAVVTDGEVVLDQTMSGGYYAKCGTFLGNGNFNPRFTWTLSSAQLDAAAGRLFHVVIRFASTTNITALRFRLKLKVVTAGGTVTLWTGPVVYLDTAYGHIIRDLGVLRLPPKLAGYGSLISLNFVLEAAYDSGSDKYFSVDFLQLLPADGWRVLEAVAYTFPINYRLIDDAINDVIYLDNGSGLSKLGSWVGSGKPLLLEPGKDQRLYFLIHNDNVSALAPIDGKMSVKLFYRPRRLTV